MDGRRTVNEANAAETSFLVSFYFLPVFCNEKGYVGDANNEHGTQAARVHGPLHASNRSVGNRERSERYRFSFFFSFLLRAYSAANTCPSDEFQQGIAAGFVAIPRRFRLGSQ